MDAKTHLSPANESMLFRIFQEALKNCAKHAGAKSISIILNHIKRRTTLTIQDDGTGFDLAVPETAESNSLGLGLQSMLEMAKFIGGQLIVDSQVGKGTRIEVTI